jgi:putative mRNA 3-end processing factor
VDRAVVTHAHGDHLRWGCAHYLVAEPGGGVTRARLGAAAQRVETAPYGEARTINGVRVSLHPAGHILGSAQVRVEHRGEVWVVSGDYKTDPDPTCAPWEPVRCHTFVTESTFGLPLYRWPPAATVFGEINAWWRANAAQGLTSFLYAYALGKAQRLLAGVDPSIGPILLHGAADAMTAAYREAGVALPATRPGTAERGRHTGALVIAPPSVDDSAWARRFGPSAAAFASGWMLVRGARRRRGVARGFVLSDHVDWPQLLGAIDATGAQRVWVTHGFSDVVVRWLTERGLEAQAIPTRWEGDEAGGTEADDAKPDGGEDEAREAPASHA